MQTTTKTNSPSNEYHNDPDIPLDAPFSDYFRSKLKGVVAVWPVHVLQANRYNEYERM